MPRTTLTLLFLLLFTGSVLASTTHHSPSPYAGFEDRAIKSLSEDDIEELRRGGGWGLALPAELNGVPGPAHLLELRNEIPLEVEQVAAIESLFRVMREEAIPAGERLIEAERAIEQAFAERRLDEARLQELLQDAEAARTELRFVHLARHLDTLEILTDDQVARYNQLRGYADTQSDPCDGVPEGHDPGLHRQHMGCG
ncbi:Spy/CpxP family protein refolding chaperone [Halomonas sp. C05BenzN]|uniref:Spy/CpxP family protein refolding chaperone n=1 Tax=Halomonas sp. C05BenzN TaxID=3411041 RepID=UPI003B922B0E